MIYLAIWYEPFMFFLYCLAVKLMMLNSKFERKTKIEKKRQLTTEMANDPFHVVFL